MSYEVRLLPYRERLQSVLITKTIQSIANCQYMFFFKLYTINITMLLINSFLALDEFCGTSAVPALKAPVPL